MAAPVTDQPDPFRFLVTGSRHWHDGPPVWAWLDVFLRDANVGPRPVVVVEGEAPGVDRLAKMWAFAHGYAVDPFEAHWRVDGVYRRWAGNERNQEMVDAGADLCAGFPTEDSRGTWDCLRRAHRAGIRCRVVALPGGEIDGVAPQPWQPLPGL
jgi:YspA, cpYpsA-related SLOG family